jgi:hypothetical protein
LIKIVRTDTFCQWDMLHVVKLKILSFKYNVRGVRFAHYVMTGFRFGTLAL